MNISHFKESEDTWNCIAESFDATRKKPWGYVIDFINSLSSNAIVADIGCGNGRHLLLCTEKFKICIGLDISINLLHITKKKVNSHVKNILLIQGNLVRIPLKDNSVETVLFIAALHNIKGRENRVSCLKEVKRILKPTGKGLLSVWTQEQDRFRDYFVNKDDSKKEFGDILISWNRDSINIPRFYHLYRKDELLNDIQEAGLKINLIDECKICSKKYPDNYFCLVSKG
ncbi:MAG: class I SAM-dependent methyltransferase [Thermoplasmatota archaeon]